jgi:ADP-ribose pyrophosphatase
VSESFTLVRAHGLTRVGEGGGVPGHEEIIVHLVEREAIPAFVEERRAEGIGIDVRLLLLLGGALLD